MSAPEPAHATVTTAYALATRDAQNITVSVHGVTAKPQTRDAFDVYVKPKPTRRPSPSSPRATAPRRTPDPASPRRCSTAAAAPPAEWMAAAGIASSDWGYVDYIVSRESGWNPNATNSSSGACGLVQALPCSKVPGNGYDPVDNLRWGNGYAVGRYGSWGGPRSVLGRQQLVVSSARPCHARTDDVRSARTTIRSTA